MAQDKILEEVQEPLEGFVPGDPEMTLALNDMAAEAQERQPFIEEVGDASDFYTYVPKKATRTNSNANKLDAVSSAALTGNNTYDSANQIKQELDANGESNFLTELKQYVAADTDQTRRAFIESSLSDPNISPQETADLLRGYAATREVGTKIQDEFAYRLSIVDNSQTEEEAIVQDIVPSVIDKKIELDRMRTQQENRIAVTLDPDTLGVVADMGMLILPFIEQRMVTKIKAELGMENSWIEAIFTGEGKQSIRDAMLRMSREEVHSMYERLADSINNNANIMGVDNNLMKSFLLPELMGDAGYPNYLRVIDNTVGMLDVLGVGWGAKRVARRVFGGVRAGTPSALAREANMRAANNELAEALGDESGVIADTLNIEKTDIASDVMPKPVGSSLEGAPDAVVETMERLDRGATDLINRTGGQRLIYTAEEIEATNKSSFEYLESITGVKFRLGMSTFGEVGKEGSTTGFAVNAIFGANGVSGWKTLKSAKAAATRSFGKDQPLEFYVRDPVTDQLHSVRSKEGKKQVVVNNGDYYVQYRYNQTYDKTQAGVFGADAVTRIGSLPKVGKYLQDATSRFNEIIRGGALTYTDQVAKIEADIMHETRQVFANLPEQSKARLLEAIEEGARSEKNWSYEELVTRFDMTEKEATAALTFRRTQDTLWVLQNREVYKGLRSKKMDSLFVGGKDTGMFAKKLDEADAKGINSGDAEIPIYDPKENTTRTATRKEIEELYARDGSVVQLNQPVYIKNDKYSYTLVEASPTKSGATVLKPLTRSPLSYKKGYYQRFYEEPYIVRKVYTAGKLNGKLPSSPNSETLYTAGDLSTAQHIAERLRGEHIDDTTVKFEAVRSRDLEDAARETSDWESMTRGGLLSGRHRGEQLGSVEGLAKIQDPLESLVRASRAVSNKVGMGEWMDVMRVRWANSYPDLMSKGEMPSSVEAIQKLGRTTGVPNQKINEAVAIFEYMKMMENIPTKLSKKWQGVALDIAEAVEGRSRLLAAGLRKSANTNPIRGIKSTAYKTFIALNPLRQLPIQASQLLQMIAIDGRYVLSGAMAKDIGALSVGMAGQNKLGAKMMGLPQKDYDALLKSFKDGGMPYAIDQHQFIEGSVIKADQTLNPQSGGVRVAKAPLQAVKSLYARSKNIGFDAGEFTNIAGHWLVAQRRFAQRNPGVSMKSQEAVDKIGFLARELSYSMNRAGKLGHQGFPTSMTSEFLSVPLQFFSIPHKAFMSVTSSKVYTKGEKLRLVALNFGLFGAAGIPAMSQILDTVRESYDLDMDDETWVATKGGLIDWGLSNGLNHVFSDEGDNQDYLTFSKNIAPGGGGLTPLVNLYDGISRNNMAKPLFGASFNVGSRVWQGAQQMAAITEKADWSTPEKMARGLETLLAVTGGGSNYFKAMFALKYHKMMSAKGQTTVETGNLGAAMKLFGISTYAESDYYATVISLSEMTKDIKSDVDRFIDSHMAVFARLPSDNDWKQENEMRQGIFNIFDDPQARAIALDWYNQRMDMMRSNNGNSLGYRMALMATVQNSDMATSSKNRVQNNQAISVKDRLAIEEMQRALSTQPNTEE